MSFDPYKYPIVMRIFSGYLTASSPDFGIYVTKRFDDIRNASEIGELYLDLMKKVATEAAKLSQAQKSLPQPAPSKDMFQSKPKADIGISEAATILQISQDMLRRLSDAGKIPTRFTPGGHRKFAIQDLRSYLEKENLEVSQPSGLELK